MAEYTNNNMTVLKSDKKDILLTSKDPHLSHLFEHNGPNTPHNVTPEGLQQSSMDVDGVYQGTVQEDYPLFEEQGGSYMPDLSPDTSHMMLDNNQRGNFANNISTSAGVNLNKNKNSSNGTLQGNKSQLSEHRDMILTSARSSPKIKAYHQQQQQQQQEGAVSTSTKQPHKQHKMLVEPSRNINPNWNGIASRENEGERYNLPPHLLPIASSQVAVIPPLISPPADHYNMQLLAHSAQQHQQLLQEEQQRQQQQHVQGFAGSQGSSSGALQQLAIRARLNQQHQVEKEGLNDAAMVQKLISAGAAYQPQSKEEAKMFPKITTPQPFIIPAHMPMSLAATPLQRIQGHGWAITDRATPEYIRLQQSGIKLGPLLQDMPIGSPASLLSMQGTTDESRNTPKLRDPQRAPAPSNLPPVSNGPEPELKSPLDHPEHQLDGQNRSRFFSSDNRTVSVEEEQAMDDEAPLNDRDKAAAAALSKLLEQSEKTQIDGGKPTSKYNHPNETATIPKMLQLQQNISRDTPPPTYDNTLHSSDPSMQQFIYGPQYHQLPAQQLQVATTQHNISNGVIKQEPTSPAITTGFVQHFMSNPVQSKTQQSYGVSNPPDLVLRANQGYIAQYNNRLASGPGGLQSSVHSEPQPSISTSTKVTAAARSRRTSSSGSSGRKNSDGSLTCNLCGHTFRSTPALNGHMRVHSTSDKKQNKEDRHQRSLNENNKSNISSPVHNPFVQFSNMGQSSPNFISGVNVDPSLLPPLSQPHAMISANQNRNGLLDIASAATLLKSDPTKLEYTHPGLSQAYVVPTPMLLPQPPMLIGTGLNEQHPPPKLEPMGPIDPQTTGYHPFYAAQLPPGLPFSNLNFATANNLPNPPHILTQDFNPQFMAQVMDRELLNPQTYVIERPQAPENTVPASNHDETNFQSFSYQNQPNHESNPLSQLASIAVATGNRDNVQELPANYPNQYDTPEIHRNIRNSNVTTDAWMGSEVNHRVNDLTQQPIYNDPNMNSETSPIRTGNDPFILPVTAPVHGQFQSRFGEYGSNPIIDSDAMNRETTVTWKDHEYIQSDPLMSSYDDPLMRDAVNVANPSKILPNSMMGGTPTGSMFGSARSFRQRHHSEGSHLIKTSSSSILKQILHSPVPTVKLRQGKQSSEENSTNDLKLEKFDNNNIVKDQKTTNSTKPVSNKQSKTVKQEVWAEPKPVQRRIRRRRHSADCRLLLKSGPLSNTRRESRLLHNTTSPLKKSTTRHVTKTRHRPPPLVIPLTVNAYSANSLYYSHLHKHRRPSGDSASSYSGVNDKIPPYTPPPMLSPIRAGSGLYCTTPVTPSVKFLRQLSHNEAIPPIPELDESIPDEEDDLARSTDPKINIGSRFQATIPTLCPKHLARSERHKAEKIWNISAKSAENNKIITHLEQFMELSCSAVVPYGGSNKEYALDCLYNCNGDILNAVRSIISKKIDTPKSENIISTYTGSGKPWSPQEVKLFDRGMLEHRKDFSVISKQIKTRNTFECVERYYHIVKRHRRRIQRPRRFRGDGSEKDILSKLADPDLDAEKRTSSSDEEKERSIYFGNGPGSWPLPPTNYDIKSPPQINPVPQYSMQQNKTHPQPEPVQKRPYKTHTNRVKQVRVSSLSPAGSPASSASLDDQPPQIFTCPVCGKSFAKVKSRNAHMKTHGKQAQEKRRLREEEAARKREEKNRPPAHRMGPMRPEFIPPAAVPQTFVHPHHHAAIRQNMLSHYGGNS